MAFADPFPGLKKPLYGGDIVRALRLDLAAELEASNMYEAHADAIAESPTLSNSQRSMLSDALRDISDEEKVHHGELLRLINYMTNNAEGMAIEAGEKEAESKFPGLTPGFKG